MAECVVMGDDDRLRELARVCRKAFAPSTVIGRELTLARALVEGPALSSPAAARLVDNVRDFCRSVDDESRNAEHRAAVTAFEALGVRPAVEPHCELVDALFHEQRSSADPVRLTLVEECAVKMLQETRAATDDVVGTRDLLAEKLLVERFNAHYGRELSRSQKRLLTAVATADSTVIEQAVATALDDVTHAIDTYVTATGQVEPTVKERLVESRQLVDTVRRLSADEAVEGCMRLFTLAAELESREDG